MNKKQRVLGAVFFVSCFVVGNSFGMEKMPKEQYSLIDAIEKDDSMAVFELLKDDSENSLGDKNFIEMWIAPFLSDEDPRVRGLASLFLYKKMVDAGVSLSKKVLDFWKVAALDYSLKDVFRTESPLCAASIRIMGEHQYGKTEDDAYGLAIAIAQPGTVSASVQRKDLDEHYLVIAGQGDVWLKDIKSGKEQVLSLKPGVTVKIPRTSIVQYTNTGKTELVMLVPTNPPYNVIGKKTNWKIEEPFEKGKWAWESK